MDRTQYHLGLFFAFLVVAYVGSAFIATREANAVEAYK